MSVEKIAEQASHASRAAADVARQTAAHIDNSRPAAATGLDSAATALRGGAQHLPGERARATVDAAAEQLSAGAQYVRTHDAKRMKSDVESIVKKNPGPALLVAALVGFCVGAVLSRD